MPVAAKKTTAKKAAPKKPVVSSLEAEFEFVRETTGTYRFNEVGDPEEHMSGAVYLKKGPLDGTAPARIKVTVEVLSVQSDK